MDIALFVIRIMIMAALLGFFGVLLAVLLREPRLDPVNGVPPASLIVLEEDGREAKRYALESPMWIGRDPNCAILLKHDSVSARHARVDWRAREAAWHAEDNVSRNGTWVNGERVSQRALSAGDVLTVGSVRFRFELDKPL